MNIRVSSTDDPRVVLNEASDFLTAEPILNNQMLTWIHERVARDSGDGRYWIARADDDAVCGVAFLAPLDGPVLLSAMTLDMVNSIVESIAGADIELSGVRSTAATAATFAGLWASRVKTPASPHRASRLYECREVLIPTDVRSGQLNEARETDRDLLIDWLRGFMADIGEPTFDPTPMVDATLAEGRLWVWDDGGPVAIAATAPTVEKVVRIQAVYTPPENRGKGYATGLVTALTERALSAGNRSTLFTELDNPTSNSVYQRIGYRPLQEMLRYKFG